MWSLSAIAHAITATMPTNVSPHDTHTIASATVTGTGRGPGPCADTGAAGCGGGQLVGSSVGTGCGASRTGAAQVFVSAGEDPSADMVRVVGGSGSRTRPSNHARDSRVHSIPAATITTIGSTSVTSTAENIISTATTVSPTRAPRCRRSA